MHVFQKVIRTLSWSMRGLLIWEVIKPNVALLIEVTGVPK
jgi:hypothetical protein